MLYIFHGTDTQISRGKVRGLVESLIKKKPDAALFRLNSETFNTSILEEYIKSQGLFALQYIVVLDNVLENPESEDILLESVKDIADSGNVFIVLEGKLSKKVITKLEKHADKIQKFELKAKDRGLKTGKDFNIFSLTDALGGRDRKKLWVLYQGALRSGAVAEELHGILFWQAKTMLLVAEGSTVGLKPFVVGKAKRFLSNWTEPELKNLSSNLVSLYHNARRGGPALDIGLETFLLSV